MVEELQWLQGEMQSVQARVLGSGKVVEGQLAAARQAFL